MLERPASSRDAARNTMLGVAAALATVVLWSGWIVGTRHGAVRLDLAAVAVVRFGIPALVFLPALLKTGLLPRGVSLVALAAMVCCGGFGFFFVAAFGLRYAPAAEAGPLMPATMPLFVALLAVAFGQERLGLRRGIGFLLIAAGVVAVAGYHLIAEGRLSIGHLLVIGAAFVYAVFPLVFRQSGLSAFAVAALVSAWSAILVTPFGIIPLIATIEAGLGAELLLQGFVQGVVSGVLAMVCYTAAVSRLGAARASALTALIPVMVALLGIPLLGEWPNAATWTGIAIVSFGVVLATWPRATA